MVAIGGFINKNRYTTNPSPNPAPDMKEFADLFRNPPLYNLVPGMSHTEISQAYARSKGGRGGFKVYVYENGVLVDGSPFPSYNAAKRVLGLKGNRTIARYIDTGK